MNTLSKIPVVFSTDHNFVMPTSVAMLSMLESSPDVAFDIFILQSEDVSDDDCKILNDIVSSFPSSSIQYISLGQNFSGAFEIRGISKASYYRLLIPWLIPQYDKVLYLDGDIVVMRNISELYNHEIGNNYIAGVAPFKYDGHSYHDYAFKLGLKATDYINAGILLINSKKMRQDNLKDSLMEEAKKKYTFLDQDILNVVCKDKIALLPWKYNYTPHTTLSEEPENICIYHYAGPKPWNILTGHWIEWYDVYRRSPLYQLELSQQVVFNTWQQQHYSTKQLIGLVLKQTVPCLYNLVVRFRNKV
jgi:lipopolysaccharide biosynthesis glycosyltransferase